jgi:hypothetical protein
LIFNPLGRINLIVFIGCYMRNRNWVLLSLVLALSAAPAHAWYGPQCYSSKVRKITLTLASIAGESAGNLQVSFDEPSQNIVKLESLRSSESEKDLHRRPVHEVVLVRESDYDVGTFAVTLTSPYSKTGYKYEFEIRDHPSECQGAFVKISGADAPRPAKKVPPSIALPAPLPAEVNNPPVIEEEKIPAPEPPLELPAVFATPEPIPGAQP